MGGQTAKAAPPSPVLEKPWREINWSKKQDALDYVNNYKPYIKDQQLRILLHGAVGAGKSSFINSVQSVLRGRMCTEALTDTNSKDCFTKEYTTYKIQKGSPETFYPFVLNDIMGLSKDKGVLVDDIKLAFKGHVMDDYKFNPESKLSVDDPFYNEAPTANDRVHLLVCVVPADKLPCMSDEVKKKIRDVRVEASRLGRVTQSQKYNKCGVRVPTKIFLTDMIQKMQNRGIPQVAVLTKVDLACPEVGKDLKNVYRSKYLKEMMEQFSSDVGIPVNCIFPVKNYHEKINFNDDVDSLILSALKHIIDFGDDFINRRIHNVYH
ncbi:interferon-induced protein 44-like isoform X2 [Anabas testudineus]|uniref:G domain-containing protein n=1 Tax=Anabas testudineus TaxID=64144 RepID=A0A3Q1IIM1_ANATE|nr:interferon-induced protein 44-like isoform X2 [Anabas testudineus]